MSWPRNCPQKASRLTPHLADLDRRRGFRRSAFVRSAAPWADWRRLRLREPRPEPAAKLVRRVKEDMLEPSNLWWSRCLRPARRQKRNSCRCPPEGHGLWPLLIPTNSASPQRERPMTIRGSREILARRVFGFAMAIGADAMRENCHPIPPTGSARFKPPSSAEPIGADRSGQVHFTICPQRVRSWIPPRARERRPDDSVDFKDARRARGSKASMADRADAQLSHLTDGQS